MTMPRFTAESSLNKTSGHYRTGRQTIKLRTQMISAIDRVGATELGPPTCPGRPPAPKVCAKVICNAADLAWEYAPLAVGTPCQGTGICDGQMHCVFPQPGQQLAISGHLLNVFIDPVLAGSTFSIDGTGNSPPIVTGHRIECVDGPGPIPVICWEIPETAHSYVQFSDKLKQRYPQLTDYGLDHPGRFCKVGICATVNQIHGDLGAVRVVFGEGGVLAYAKLIVPMQSASPTLLLDFPVPNLELTNMQVTVFFDIRPGDDGVSIRAENVQGSFTFDSNLSHFPDWFVSPFYDIDQMIRNKVENMVRRAFENTDRRDALAAALTNGIDAWARATKSGWKGFKQILSVRVSGGRLIIDYVPN